MKLGIVVQRYGADINGGAEQHARYIAERLAKYAQVEVLTTCAQDYITWENEYAEGTDRVRGVTVRRFANAQTRDSESDRRPGATHKPHASEDQAAAGAAGEIFGVKAGRWEGGGFQASAAADAFELISFI